MTMTTTSGELAAHMAADLACQFARRHASLGEHALAAENYIGAADLYGECGCGLYQSNALALASAENRLAGLYGERLAPL